MHQGSFPKHFQNSNHLSSKYFRVISLGKEISYAKKTICRGPWFSHKPLYMDSELLPFEKIKSVDEGGIVGEVFLDLKKSFDTESDTFS